MERAVGRVVEVERMAERVVAVGRAVKAVAMVMAAEDTAVRKEAAKVAKTAEAEEGEALQTHKPRRRTSNCCRSHLTG